MMRRSTDALPENNPPSAIPANISCAARFASVVASRRPALHTSGLAILRISAADAMLDARREHKAR